MRPRWRLRPSCPRTLERLGPHPTSRDRLPSGFVRLTTAQTNEPHDLSRNSAGTEATAFYRLGPAFRSGSFRASRRIVLGRLSSGAAELDVTPWG